MIAWALDALIASALLMAGVLLVRGPVRRAFGPQVAYALWALPALRLLLPPLPAGWWRADVAAPIRHAGETITVFVIDSAPPIAAAPGVPVGLIVAALWAIGAGAFLVWHLVRHARFCDAVVRSAEPLDERDGIRVIASPAAPGPLAFGVWRRYVAFPRDFTERYDPEERALALAHELGHHARRDLLANWAALVVLALHWFNPLAWRAFHAFRADQELANDARVLAGCAPADRHAYGRAIVKAAHGGAVSAACHLHTISDLKGRLRMLTTSRTSRRRLAAGSAAVTLLVAGGLGLTASSSAAERITAGVDDALQVAVAAPSLVTVPTPPAPPPPSAGARHTRHVVVVRNGRTQTFEGAAADAYIRDHDVPVPPVPPGAAVAPAAPDAPRIVMHRFGVQRGPDGSARAWAPEAPEVSSARCPGDSARPVVEHSEQSGRQRILICTNRIEAMSREAERLALNSAGIERHAMTNALEALQRARTSIVVERNLTEDQRRSALESVDEALAEMKADTHDDD